MKHRLRHRYGRGWRKRARNETRNVLARRAGIPTGLLAAYGHSYDYGGLRSALLEARGEGATHVTRQDDHLYLVYREGNRGKYEAAGVKLRDGQWIRTPWEKAAFDGWLPTTAQPIGEMIRRAA